MSEISTIQATGEFLEEAQDNIVNFPTGISPAGDYLDTNSEEIESSCEEDKSLPVEISTSIGKKPSVEIPADCLQQPILTEEVLSDLENLSKMDLRNKYKTEEGTHRNMKSRLKAKGLEPASQFKEFRSFLIHVGVNPFPQLGWSLNRLDNTNDNYGPGLVRWDSPQDQNNNKSDTVTLTMNDVTKPLTVWAQETGQKANTLRSRRKKGWSDYEVVRGRKNPPKQSTADSETDCNQPSDEPLQESSPSVVANKQVEFDEYDFLYPRQVRLVNIYKTSMKEYYGEIIITVPKKDVAMLTKIADAIRDAGYLEETVLLFIFRFWPQFASHACKKNGWWSEPPEVPAFGFLTKAANRILGFVETHGKGRLGSIIMREIKNKRLAEEQEQMAEEQQRLEKLNKKKWKFVLKFLKSTPEYKNLKARSKAHRKLKSSMNKAEWKCTNTDLVYEMAQLKQTQGSFQVALKAWKRKQNK